MDIGRVEVLPSLRRIYDGFMSLIGDHRVTDSGVTLPLETDKRDRWIDRHMAEDPYWAERCFIVMDDAYLGHLRRVREKARSQAEAKAKAKAGGGRRSTFNLGRGR